MTVNHKQSNSSKMTQQRVTLNVKEQIAYVCLNRPAKRNALDMKMFEAIVAVQKQIGKDKNIRVVILQGKGQDFCSGLDIKAVMSNKSSAIKLLMKFWPFSANLAQKVSHGWRKLKVPVIASIQGRCWGGGLQIALGADFRLASDGASFSIMESKWGLIPDMSGTLSLRDNLSKQQAMRLTMTAETFSAQQSLEYGIVSELSDAPLQSAELLAKQLINRSPDVLWQVKKLYHKHWQSSNSRILAAETFSQWKILLGKNQTIAVQREKGKDLPYQ